MQIRPPDHTLEAALRDVEHDNPKVAVRAAAALGRLGEEDRGRACGALRALLNHDDPELRYTAALSLGELRDGDALGPLMAMVDGDGHPMPRQAAVIALGLLGDREAAGVLREALRHGPPDVRFQATTSLSQADPQGAIKPLRRALSDDDPEVRASAAAALGDLRDPGSADPVARLLDDSRAEVCLEAAVALARLGDTRGTETLCRALGESSQRLLAAEHLFGCPDPRAEAVAQKTLAGWFTPPEVKVYLAGLLCRLGHDEAQETLARLLKSSKMTVRGLAIQVLGALDKPWAVQALRDFAQTDQAVDWQEEIADALDR